MKKIKKIVATLLTAAMVFNLGMTGAAHIGIQFPGVGIANALAISGYLITEFDTQHISRAIYVDVGLKWQDLFDPGIVGIRGFGFQ